MIPLRRLLGGAAALGLTAVGWGQTAQLFAPATAIVGQVYTVQATGSSPDDSLSEIDLRKNGQLFKTAGYEGYVPSADLQAQDSSSTATTITYTERVFDDEGVANATAVTAINNNSPPVATVTIDGHASGDTITIPATGSVSITVRYKATDVDGNLSGIRPQVWNDANRDGNYTTNEYFYNNSGNFVAESGSSGEVDLTVTLNAPGAWYFWTDSEDSAGATDSSGAWTTQSFYLNVVRSISATASPTTFTYNGGTQGPTIAVSPSGATYTISGTASATNANPSGYSFTVTATGSNYTGSVPFTWHIEPASQTVTLSPTSASVTAGGSVTFTASGGENGYVWGGSASGSGSSKEVSFPTVGSASVTVYSPSSTNYAQSNTPSASVTVKLPPPVITSADSANGTVGSAFRYTITASNSPTSYGASNLPAGLTVNTSTGLISGTPTQAGSFASPISAANSGGTSPPATLSFTIGQGTQSAVTVSPGGTLNYPQGQQVTFTASGGSGTGAYVWGGYVSGTGPTNTITFDTTGGPFTIQVYRAADANYQQSSTATATVNITASGDDPTQLKVLVPGQ